ncbi:MAG TPA: pentapeptide repeat-containing protein [Candidatus Scybalomonas excrementigallinarum]|nr:pentapeptide repeat-containing protein [Candidatus Scybalomonas excrementigallinarum]
MIREEALQKFQIEQQEWIDTKKEEFIERIGEKLPELVMRFKQMFHKGREEMEQVKKDPIMFFYFSVLRTELWSDHYHLLLHMMDARWYLDKEPIVVEESLDFLWDNLQEIKEKLFIDSKKYMGKINRYDIEYIIQDMVFTCNSYLAEQLRFVFRDIEENEDFDKIEKPEVWYIRFGEYRDHSEILAHVDRVKKEQKQWERKVRKAKSGEQEDSLATSYWYELEVKESSCTEQFMPFVIFENCTLEQVDFTKSNLRGARFLNCTMRQCVFEEANLQYAEFTNCTWEETKFQGADLSYAIFMEQELPFVHLEPEQLQVIFVEREEKAQ